MKNFMNLMILANIVLSAPTEEQHALQYVKRNGVEVPFWYPKVVSKNNEVAPSLVEPSFNDSVAFGKEQLLNELKLSNEELQIQQSYQDEAGVTHLYAIRTINGVKVDNHNAAIHVKNGQVLSFSSSFVKEDSLVEPVLDTKPSWTLDRAAAKAAQLYGAPRDSYPASLVYIQVPSGNIVLAHQFQLRDDSKSKWLQVSVDAKNGQVIQVVDYVQQASYLAIKFPKGNPKQGFETIVDPADLTASPEGWNSDGTTKYTVTRGNNVDSRIGSLRAEGGSDLVFTHNWNEDQAPTTDENKKAAIINNFYVSNWVHDIAYQYGFTEKTGNFQINNFNRGGLGNDAVNINNHAPGQNNANFASTFFLSSTP
jgi:extracellular elastinolytic metalloproteinase